MTLYEHFWDCPACGREGISALRQLKCPSCGYSKTGQDVENRSRIEITDTDGITLAKGGPHWVCSSCGSVNLDKYSECVECGNSKEEDDHQNMVRNLDSLPPVYYPKTDKQFYDPGGDVKEESSDIAPEPEYVPAVVTQFDERKFNKFPWFNKTNIGYSAIALVVVAAFAIFGYLFFNTKKVEAPVVGFSWSRDVTLQRYQVVHHTDESSTAPGAYNISSREVPRQVPVYRDETTTRDCSYDTESCTDLGNGSESCTTIHHSETCTDHTTVLDHYDTVYDTKYTYDLNEWVYERTEHSNANDRNPYWPEYQLVQENQNIIGAERVGGRTEIYTIYFEVTEKDKVVTYLVNAPEDQWYQYNEKESYTLQINHFGKVMNDPLEDKLSNK